MVKPKDSLALLVNDDIGFLVYSTVEVVGLATATVVNYPDFSRAVSTDIVEINVRDPRVATRTIILAQSFAFSNIALNRLYVSMNIAPIAVCRKEGSFLSPGSANVRQSNEIGPGYPFRMSGASVFTYSLIAVVVDQFWSSIPSPLSLLKYR